MKVASLVLVTLLVACGSQAAPAHHDKLKVITTFSTLNSFVEAVGGDYVTVRNLVPVGASPETYQPTPQDIAALADANLLVENGSGIEVWLQLFNAF